MEKIRNAQLTRLTHEGSSAQAHLLAAFTRIKHKYSPAFLEPEENAKKNLRHLTARLEGKILEDLYTSGGKW